LRNFMDPVARTKKQLAEHRRAVLLAAEKIARGPTPASFTCDDCELAPRCTLVFDLYNTDGDCLLEK